jgi:hypothetical protein
MTIVVSVLFVTAVWIFLAAVLGGCGGQTAAPRDSDSLFGGEFWLWERRDGGVGRRGADRPLPRRVGAPRSDRAAISSPTA